MTYSIVARDPDTGAFGVATATGGPCVGALVPHVASGVGAIATQGDTNPYYGHDGLALMRGGGGAEEVVRTIISGDPGRGRRQFAGIGRTGAPAAFCGDELEPFAGSVAGAAFAAVGNMLANQDVLEAMALAFDAGQGPLEEKLLAALKAGEAAGGDRRGTRSAALVVCSREAYPDIDCRVDLSEAPIADLAVLLEVTRSGDYGEFLADRPRRNPSAAL